jgi:hypothetical protein
MQPTQNSTHADSTPGLPWFTWLRNLLLNPLMRSLTIIETNIFLQNPLNLILPDSPQQDVVFLLEQCVFREDNPF